MKILAHTFAVFWSFKGDQTQFHADVPAKTAPEAVQSFRDLYPDETIRSVRDTRGRFQTFGG